MSKTLDQLGGDLTLFQEVMDIFLAEAPIHLAALRVAIERGQAEAVREDCAHPEGRAWLSRHARDIPNGQPN